MPSRAVSLSELVNHLGGVIITVVLSAGDPVIDDVSLAEPAEGVAGFRGDLLLGVGVATEAEAVEVVEAAGRQGVAAVAFRPRLAHRPAVLAASRESRVALVRVAESVGWAHLAWVVREILDGAGGGHPTELAGPDELFVLADACARLLDAPVTIEDTRSRVLAYSERHDLTDPIRVSTIVGRRVPADVVTDLRARGVFRHLARSAEPLFLPAARDGSLGPRLVVPVRAGREWVGSIWAMVAGPVPDDVTRALRDVAAVVALHLLRLRSEADQGRRRVGEQLRAALAGDAVAVGTTLPSPPWRVVVLSQDPEAGVEASVGQWESMFRRARWHRPLLTRMGDEAVTVVTHASAERTPGSWPWLVDLLARIDAAQVRWAMAGPLTTGPTALEPGLRAAQELAALRRRDLVAGSSLTSEEAWADLVVQRAVAATVAEPASDAAPGESVGPLADGVHVDRALADTLGAWLDHPGDLRACAEILHVHPNTVRHRIGRLRGDLGVDLADPTVRLALGLQVRAARWQ